MPSASEQLSQIVSESASLISIRTLLVALMNEFGGPVGLAMEMKKDFDVAPLGSPMRVRIETDLLKALQSYGAEDEDGEDDLEDLENLAAKLLSKDAQ
jgi:hypothetical protein